MFSFMVTSEGGLTTAGYAIAIIAGIVLFLAAIYFAGKNSEKKKLTTRQLVFCAVAMALAFVTSYLKIFTLPWGGSVTLCSMLFIVLVANWYGVGTGITVGLAYGILQFIQEPYVLSFFQVLHPCICRSWYCRFLCQTEPRPSERLHRSRDRTRIFPCTRRISVLDELHAG